MSADECNILDSIFQTFNLNRNGTSCCNWRKVECSSGRVTALDLSGNQLSGSIPAELGKLPNLRYLYLENNQLSGSIPADLGKLSNLEVLYLSYNQLSGPIPADLGKLPNLQRLHLYNNQLSGPIPAELGKLSNLQRLDLENNQLSGSIPADLGKLSNLEVLILSRNQLSGSIPADLGKLPNLQRLILSRNQLSGSIPADLGKLSNLRELHLYNNQLSGPIASLPNVSTNCSIITSASSNSNSKLCLAPSFNKTGKCFDNLKQFSIPDCPVPIFPGPTAPPEPLATTSGLPLAAVFGIIAAVFVVTLIVFVGCFWCRRSVSQPSNNMESPANSAATMVDLSLTKPEAAMPGLQKSVESMLPSQGLVDLQPVNQSLSKDHNAIVPAGSQVRSAGVAGDETLYLGDAPGRVVKKDNESDVLYIA
ncbi:hypothetical protein BCR44DRAFT_1444112 [Catenaria anguillulae PL171]|uniref:non-specific serine/threonine protein kinase n=1 Tax=Catenaria anguillulae PL171 TaxID=765915 RepID=A0A1Y2H7W1_9FUNG|nr:hypothetical protein BCR44DRAFT_1444112 [Catenaria anguillulae PL171]